MKFRTLLLAGLAAGAFAAPAAAQETTTTRGFVGGHFEVITAYDKAKASVDEDENPATPQNSIKSEGTAYGIAGGFDFGGPSVIFGIEGEAMANTNDFCETGLCLETGRDLYAGGRIGTVLRDSVLLYVKGGYSNQRVHAVVGTGEDRETVGSTNLDGIRGGVGLEWDTGSALLVKLEYRYTNYESDFSRHQGLLGLGMRF